jgi:peptidoglycan/xylan/chitin deacetylase (PgdA/CDA1 family)
LNLSKPIFSFTFDDVPISAMVNGSRILEENNVTGTFYISSKRCGLSNDISLFDSKQKILSKPEENIANMIFNLHMRGHHIGCHSHSHENLTKLSAKDIKKDSRKNRVLLSSILDGAAVDHFSYPYGAINDIAIKSLRKDYKTLRGIQDGVNRGMVYLSMLKAVKIYSLSLNKSNVIQWIKLNTEANGWLIFYTHGIDLLPNEFGTTPFDLQWVIEECRKTAGEMLNVRDAYKLIQRRFI